MDIKERAAKRKRIGQDIDLTGSKLREAEVDALYDFVINIKSILGKTRTIKESYTGPSAGGKFTRIESDTYTISRDKLGIFIDRHHEDYDDDGDGINGVFDERISGARGILNTLRKVFQ